MKDFMFQEPLWLVLLVVVGIVGFLKLRAQRKVKAIRQKMGGKEIYNVSGWFGIIAAIFVIFALARPVSDPVPSPVYREGRDVIFMLDVSRSMLAEDVFPSRLEMAKLAIRDCMEFSAGSRFGLILFAGSASIRCPLTEDVAFVDSALNTSGPGSVSYGSTFLQSAIDKVTERLLTEKRRGFQDVIILSDGGDHSEEGLEVAAQKLRDAGARVIVVGLGNPSIASRIPIPNAEGKIDYIKEDGVEIRVKQEQASLKELASKSGGVYLNANDGIFHLGSEYLKLTQSLEGVTTDGLMQLKYKQRFIWFLLGALISLVIGSFIRRFGLPFLRGVVASLLLFSALSVNAQEIDPNEAESVKLAKEVEKTLSVEDKLAWVAQMETAETDEQRLEIMLDGANVALELKDFQMAQECFDQAVSYAVTDSAKLEIRTASARAKSRVAQEMLGQDPYVAANMMDEAELVLLENRRNNPSDETVLYDLCAVYEVRAQATALIEAQEKADEEMQKKIQELLQKLEDLTNQQRELTQACRVFQPSRNRSEPDPLEREALCVRGAEVEPRIADELTPICEGFGSLSNAMALLNKMIGGAEDQNNEFNKALNLLKNAQSDLRMAAKYYSESSGYQGVGASDAALRKMVEVLQMFAGQQESDQEGESEEESDESEMEMSDEWGEGEMESMPSESQQGRMDMQSRQLPEPQFSAEDILQEEAENNAAREQKGREGDPSVKKDW